MVNNYVRICVNCEWCKVIDNSENDSIFLCVNTKSNLYLKNTEKHGMYFLDNPCPIENNDFIPFDKSECINMLPLFDNNNESILDLRIKTNDLADIVDKLDEEGIEYTDVSVFAEGMFGGKMCPKTLLFEGLDGYGGTVDIGIIENADVSGEFKIQEEMENLDEPIKSHIVH